MKSFTLGKITQWPKNITAYTDGASRSNPGPASFGISVLDSLNQKIIFEQAQKLGVTTNNVAEYQGVSKILELAVKNKVEKLMIKTDSELIVRQIKGEYKIKSPLLKPLYLKCLKRIHQITDCQVIHIPREQNKRADELANLALDL